MSNNGKTPLGKWVKNIGTLLLGLASIIVSIVLGIAANTIAQTQMELADFTATRQMELNDSNAKAELEITELRNKNDQQLKAIELFLELIRGNTPREKEMAVRLLSILDEELAFRLAISIATNKTEDRNIALTAFRIGRQIDSARFLEEILKAMNISLSDNNTGRVRGWLNDGLCPISYTPLSNVTKVIHIRRNIVKN